MFYGISMVALLVMRFTKRDVKRPFKVNTFLCCRINDINANYRLYGGAKRTYFLQCPTMDFIGYNICFGGKQLLKNDVMKVFILLN